jgi:hypothetical protein
MKKLILLLVFPLIFISCEKNSDINYLVPENEIPAWLKTIIQQDEQVINTTPKYIASYGAWKRYEWNNEFYFEYINPLSSYRGTAIAFSGEAMSFDENTPFIKERCCMKYVWKAPSYNE